MNYGILYIQPMSLACICKHVTNLYLDGFCYSVNYMLYIYLINLNLSRNHNIILEDHSGNKYCNTFLCYPRFESRNACFYTFNNDM